MESKTMFDELATWEAERLGKITASEVSKIMKPGRKKDEYFSKTAISYLDGKIAEIITGQPAKDLAGMAAIEWGQAHEFEAVQEFENRLGHTVEYFGGANPKFFPYNSFSGGSPDGRIHTHVLEIKCPYNSAIHARNLLAAMNGAGNAWMIENREEHYWQIQFNMLCMGLEKGFYISYDPRPTDPTHRLAIIELTTDADTQSLLKERVNAAGEVVKEAIEVLFNSQNRQAPSTDEINLSKLQKI